MSNGWRPRVEPFLAALCIAFIVFTLLVAGEMFFDNSPTDVGSPPPPMVSLSHANVTIPLDIAVLFNEGQRTLWLGGGAWKLEPSGQTLLGPAASLPTESLNARFARTGGAPIVIEFYETPNDARAGANASFSLSTRLAHTYQITTATVPSSIGAARVTPHLPEEAFIVHLENGRIEILQGAMWTRAPPDEPILLHVADAIVLIEDGCDGASRRIHCNAPDDGSAPGGTAL